CRRGHYGAAYTSASVERRCYATDAAFTGGAPGTAGTAPGRAAAASGRRQRRVAQCPSASVARRTVEADSTLAEASRPGRPHSGRSPAGPAGACGEAISLEFVASRGAREEVPRHGESRGDARARLRDRDPGGRYGGHRC